jgi:hypothetical protein
MTRERIMAKRKLDDVGKEEEEMKVEVCRVMPQGKYKNGQLMMCSICSTMLGMMISGGVIPDPGSIPPDACRKHLESIMEESSSLASQEMKQISEVVNMIRLNSKSIDVDSITMVECYGTMVSGDSDEVCVREAMDPSQGDGKLLEEADGCIVKGLDAVLKEDVEGGDGIVITHNGHTTFMYKSAGIPHRWYMFDSLDGRLVCVMGEDPPAMNVNPSATKKGDLALDEKFVYTGMIMKSCTHSSPSESTSYIS